MSSYLSDNFGGDPKAIGLQEFWRNCSEEIRGQLDLL
jgi:hypothetical protein